MKVVTLIRDYDWGVLMYNPKMDGVPDFYGVYHDNESDIDNWIALCNTEEQAKILCEGLK